ncbi:cell wall hydrolase [Phenylobacterium sp.]|uniref:cell wall hydrolase n=1 Tax=Phenylobacterium sp. TaxID=1871053 RepID=UPI002DF20348|nr:cell wall hydrolase [Phenylobacterium sp.]
MRLALGLLATAALAACSPGGQRQAAAPQARLTSARLSVAQLQKLAGGADPAALGLAQGPAPINPLPAPGSVQATGDRAEQLNAGRPFAGLPIQPMRPFVLKTDAPDQARAVHCLAQAVYYEAAREPLKGQQAVAQVVLNRVRHPAYPKSVCGVVYQGASLPTGCQFTFTCNGALRWRPEGDLFARAEGVAKKALAGYVDKDVGPATHYHAAYVAPYWAPTLIKMTQVGQHIFYRWTGAWGEPAAFTGRYAGREAELTPAVLSSKAPTRAELAPEPRKVTLAVAGGEARTYQVADPGAAPADGARLPGALYAARRKPTPDEIQRINASLAAVEARIDGKPATAKVAQDISSSAHSGEAGAS